MKKESEAIWQLVKCFWYINKWFIIAPLCMWLMCVIFLLALISSCGTIPNIPDVPVPDPIPDSVKADFYNADHDNADYNIEWEIITDLEVHKVILFTFYQADLVTTTHDSIYRPNRYIKVRTPIINRVFNVDSTQSILQCWAGPPHIQDFEYVPGRFYHSYLIAFTEDNESVHSDTVTYVLNDSTYAIERWWPFYKPQHKEVI